MIRLYLRLALKSLRQNPGLSAIMIATVALGIGACVTVITMFHAMSADPIWWKSDRLYAVTLDAWDVNEPADAARPQLPPPRLTYRDAMYLLESNIPERKTVMYVARTSILSTADHAPIAAEAPKHSDSISGVMGHSSPSPPRAVLVIQCSDLR